MRRSLISMAAASLACAVLAAAAPAPAADPPYRVAGFVRAGGEGGWDYVTVDAVRRRLYVTRSNRVQVVSLDTGDTLKGIPDTPGVHGVALAHELRHGYTSNGRDSSVTVFNLEGPFPIKKIGIPGRGPDAILYDALTKRVFTC